MSSEWQGYDLTEFPELADPEDTIREALRDTIGDGEGIDDAVMQRFINKVKSDERQSLLEELTADAEHEARIGEQGNDSERVNAAEKIIEMLNDIQIEGEA